MFPRQTLSTLCCAALLIVQCGNDEDVIVDVFSPPPPDSPEAVIRSLETAYRTQNYDLLRTLLAHDPHRNADYLFYLSEPTSLGEKQWDYEVESRIHRRMFRPQDLVAGETPVSTDLWLSSVAIHLTATRPFQERPDLYSADHGADGKLDPEDWKASDAQYNTDVLFDTQSDVDYQVRGDANFVVIEDLTKHVGEGGKFLLYIWEELQRLPKSEFSYAGSSWSRIKYLYRCVQLHPRWEALSLTSS